jgi:CheY-like chemotaxis protein
MEVAAPTLPSLRERWLAPRAKSRRRRHPLPAEIGPSLGSPSLGIGATHNATAASVCDHRRMRPSVLIVDDHEDFRRSARALLQAEGFAVVGEAGDGAEAIAKARDFRPDVVLVDIQLPDLDGFAVAERIAAWPDPPVVVLISSRDAAVYRSRLASTPARGFIAKSQLSGEALADLVA